MPQSQPVTYCLHNSSNFQYTREECTIVTITTKISLVFTMAQYLCKLFIHIFCGTFMISLLFSLFHSSFLLLFSCAHSARWFLFPFSGNTFLYLYRKGQETLSIKEQVVNILNFTDHTIWSLSHLSNFVFVVQNWPQRVCKWMGMAVFQ